MAVSGSVVKLRGGEKRGKRARFRAIVHEGLERRELLAADGTRLVPELVAADGGSGLVATGPLFGGVPEFRLPFPSPAAVDPREQLQQKIATVQAEHDVEIADGLTQAVDRSLARQQQAQSMRPPVDRVLSRIPSPETILPQMLGAEAATRSGFMPTDWDSLQSRDSLHGDPAPSAATIDTDSIVVQADQLGRGDLTAFLGSLAAVVQPQQPTSGTSVTMVASAGVGGRQVAVGAFCSADGELVVPARSNYEVSASSLAGEGEGDAPATDASGSSDAEEVSIPTFEIPALEIASSDGDWDSFVPPTQATTSIVSTHGVFNLDSLANPDRQADGSLVPPIHWVAVSVYAIRS